MILLLTLVAQAVVWMTLLGLLYLGFGVVMLVALAGFQGFVAWATRQVGCLRRPDSGDPR